MGKISDKFREVSFIRWKDISVKVRILEDATIPPTSQMIRKVTTTDLKISWSKFAVDAKHV